MVYYNILDGTTTIIRRRCFAKLNFSKCVCRFFVTGSFFGFNPIGTARLVLNTAGTNDFVIALCAHLWGRVWGPDCWSRTWNRFRTGWKRPQCHQRHHNTGQFLYEWYDMIWGSRCSRHRGRLCAHMCSSLVLCYLSSKCRVEF